MSVFYGVILWRNIYIINTSNVTGRHRGPERKLQAGYRAPSLQRTSCCDYLSSLSVVSHVYSKFGHHPHPYLCAKFRFCHGLHCWPSPWRKSAYSITHSLPHTPTLFDAPGTEACASEWTKFWLLSGSDGKQMYNYTWNYQQIENKCSNNNNNTVIRDL